MSKKNLNKFINRMKKKVDKKIKANK